MKKALIFISLVMNSVLGANAQVQTATLQQGDSAKVFHGYDALVSAYNAALDGNTIYLSAGRFHSTILSKSIKIIGAGGLNADAAKNTIIDGCAVARGDESYTDYLEIESLIIRGHFQIYDDKNIKLKKANIEGCLQFSSTSNVEISQCVLSICIDGSRYVYNTIVSNSIIKGFNSYISTSSTFLITNSIIYSVYNQLESMTLQNNIIVGDNLQSGHPYFLTNNIFTGASNFSAVPNQSGNWENVSLPDLFVNQPENKWDPTYDYHLKNHGNYIGTDGTQVGIYGGLFPWNPVPSNPQILESKVEPVTSNDGKLNFQIKAEAQQ